MMDSIVPKEAEKHCVLCCQDIDIFALGKCDHPVCYRCSTKMRVLCEQKYCAVCREELDKVVFVKKLTTFSSLLFKQFPCEKKHDIYFADEKVYSQFRHLLLPECVRCPEPKVFSRFEELEHHMRKQHEVFCCRLCTKHLKIFPYERKWYNRKELARHRAHGDPDDTSHRGHPLCEFCDDRYLDNDELLKHLRRDHYFCHFCDVDGSQEYYSDYQYLSEHFRDAHYLCEEGRCATEQFTHAFRTEIDYKAHKAAAHSKSRAEARQNRHIDLQFTYAPRQQRRNEGLVTGEDYEEARHNRGGRGRHQGRQKSWRYIREEENRELAAAMRASMAHHQQVDRGVANERNAPRLAREEQLERTEPDDSKQKTTNPAGKPPVRTMQSTNPLDEEDDFPTLGATAATSASSVKSTTANVAAINEALKEDDFPSLPGVSVAATLTPAYSAPPKTHSSFKEEDFPVLVSNVRPTRPAAVRSSAWSNHTAGVKPTNQTLPPSSRHPVPVSTVSAPKLLSSSSSSFSQRKKKVGESGKAKSDQSPSDDYESSGMTQQEFRSVCTMLDISTLLTVKDGNAKPSTSVSSTLNQTPSTNISTSKASKKKKQKNPSAPSTPAGSGTMPAGNTVLVEKASQKENVPENPTPPTDVTAMMEMLPSGLANGHMEKLTVCKDSSLDQDEDFPALKTKKPPPGFKSSFPMKATTPAPSSTVPPPPGLGVTTTKPPPGFTGIPLNNNVLELAASPVNPPPKLSGNYLVPEDYQQRNLELIQSIKKYLHDDESQFNLFKNYSAQFRKGVISAAQYHHSCKDLLGEDFSRIFNELLVLLPDTGKQQELLYAHGHSKTMEKQSGAGGGRKNRNKNAWQAPTLAVNANVAAELDCQLCPTCRQVLAPKDINFHKTLHTTESEDFPSLQSISRIIS
ncbi:E3 ubiquitin-protein ligase ZNF598 [Thalassophryne amazonica]|uniref:E3 ubiquitin-protein ligase ZNF598 n=1 Tax=Thalassophryne amazonica TaxID=390379 RepID=UPI001471E439|nr:E3 ubiquitin-protein ligase ZNF598 [Thalassophryne amazonica]